MRAAKAKWFSLGRRRSLSSIPVSFGVLNPNTSAQPRLFHSRDLPFRVSFSPCQRGKKGVAMFAPNLNSSPPSLRGLILRITTLSDAEGKERKERKAGREGWRNPCESISYFDRISAKARYLLPPIQPWYREKAKRRTSARTETYPRDIESRYRSRLVAKSSSSSPPFPPSPPPGHVAFQCTSRRPGCMQQYPPPPLPLSPLTYSISFAILDTNRVAYLYGGARDQ